MLSLCSYKAHKATEVGDTAVYGFPDFSVNVKLPHLIYIDRLLYLLDITKFSHRVMESVTRLKTPSGSYVI